jgi:hypothetical protein
MIIRCKSSASLEQTRRIGAYSFGKREIRFISGKEEYEPG